MALEIENNLVAALSASGLLATPAAQFGIADVSHPGVGVYEFATLESLGDGEFATTCLIEDPSPFYINVAQVTANTWRVSVFDGAGDPADASWHVKIFRIATGV